MLSANSPFEWRRHEPDSQRDQVANESRPTRGRYRFREYTIGPDRRPEAEAHTFTMQCVVCEMCGPKSESGSDGTVWAAQHFKANPEHVAYREIVTRPYRFEPGAWQ